MSLKSEGKKKQNRCLQGAMEYEHWLTSGRACGKVVAAIETGKKNLGKIVNDY